MITYVDETGPAGKAGLKGLSQDRRGRIIMGDVLVAIDSKEVNSLDDIFHALENYKIGDTVVVKYLRDGVKKEVKIKLQAL